MNVFLLVAVIVAVHAAVIPTEIMYNPRQGSDYEYLGLIKQKTKNLQIIEIHNTDTTNSVSIGGWNLTAGT